MTSAHPLLYSGVSLIAGALCLGLAFLVLLKNPTARANRIYFLFCICVDFWLFASSLLACKYFALAANIILCKLLYTGVVFLPTLALHFSVEFLGASAPPKTRTHLKIAYLLTFTFLFLLWLTDQFIVGIYDYPWGFYPKGGPIHKLRVFFVVFTAGFCVYLLWCGLRAEKAAHGKSRFYYQTKYLFFSFLFVSLGSIDFLANMGIDLFPMGPIFVTIFIYSTTYAIFKHNVLGVSLVIKKSLIYSILISCVAVAYFLLIYLTGKVLSDWAQIHSLSMNLLLVIAIVLASRPLEIKITSLVDRLFDKRPREAIEIENTRLHEEVREQDRHKSAAIFASGMAHEIKNPLAAIRTFTEYLPKKYEDPDFRKKFEKVILLEVDRIDGLVRQLLEFSKPSPPKFENIDINEILSDTLEPLSGTFLKEKIELNLDLAAGRRILGDKNQLKQVFLNLILNAVQAMPFGGELKISTVSSEATTIHVQDTGCGIPESDVQKIFDPFFTSKEKGSGLGLAIVKNIIQAHTGKIAVESRPGSGSRFIVTLRNA